MTPVQLRPITPEQTRPLRQQLLRPGTPLDKLVFTGDLDPDTLHLGAYQDGEQVGIATFMCQPPNVSVGVPSNLPDPDNFRAWRLRGMATVAALRGQGIGAALLLAGIGYVAEQAGVFLWCNARTGAVGFYQKYRFVTIGDVYDVPHVGPHYFMQRDITPGDAILRETYPLS